jgi:hypothetical protein
MVFNEPMNFVLNTSPSVAKTVPQALCDPAVWNKVQAWLRAECEAAERSNAVNTLAAWAQKYRDLEADFSELAASASRIPVAAGQYLDPMGDITDGCQALEGAIHAVIQELERKRTRTLEPPASVATCDEVLRCAIAARNSVSGARRNIIDHDTAALSHLYDRRICLDENDWERTEQIMDNPPPPAQALLDDLALYRKLVRQ